MAFIHSICPSFHAFLPFSWEEGLLCLPCHAHATCLPLYADRQTWAVRHFVPATCSCGLHALLLCYVILFACACAILLVGQDRTGGTGQGVLEEEGWLPYLVYACHACLYAPPVFLPTLAAHTLTCTICLLLVAPFAICLCCWRHDTSTYLFFLPAGCSSATQTKPCHHCCRILGGLCSCCLPVPVPSIIALP